MFHRSTTLLLQIPTSNDVRRAYTYIAFAIINVKKFQVDCLTYTPRSRILSRKTSISSGLSILVLLLSHAPTSTSTDLGNCTAHFSDCFAADTCTACVTSIAAGSTSDAACTDYEFEEGNLCDILGVSYCCAAELSKEECLTDGDTLEYWECALDKSGCALQDMPCIGGKRVLFLWYLSSVCKAWRLCGLYQGSRSYTACMSCWMIGCFAKPRLNAISINCTKHAIAPFGTRARTNKSVPSLPSGDLIGPGKACRGGS